MPRGAHNTSAQGKLSLEAQPSGTASLTSGSTCRQPGQDVRSTGALSWREACCVVPDAQHQAFLWGDARHHRHAGRQVQRADQAEASRKRKEQLGGAHVHSRVLPDIQAQDWVALGLDHFHQGVVLVACSTHSSGSQCDACSTADALAEPQHVVAWVDCALRLAAAQAAPRQQGLCIVSDTSWTWWTAGCAAAKQSDALEPCCALSLAAAELTCGTDGQVLAARVHLQPRPARAKDASRSIAKPAGVALTHSPIAASSSPAQGWSHGMGKLQR